MKKTSNRLLNVLFTAIVSTMIVGFNIPAAAAEPLEQQGLVDKARVTFESFMADENQAWLKKNLNQAKGLIIIPSLLKAGFVIGGSGGSGVPADSEAAEACDSFQHRVRCFDSTSHAVLFAERVGAFDGAPMSQTQVFAIHSQVAQH